MECLTTFNPGIHQAPKQTDVRAHQRMVSGAAAVVYPIPRVRLAAPE